MLPSCDLKDHSTTTVENRYWIGELMTPSRKCRKLWFYQARGCLTVKILPFLTQELERGTEAEGKVGVIAMQLEEKL